MKLQNFGLQGCAWESPDGLACPTIYSDITRDHSEITGMMVNVTVLSSSSVYNWHEVVDGEGEFFARLPGEPFYDGDNPNSLVQRAAAQFGTNDVWRLVHEGEA